MIDKNPQPLVSPEDLKAAMRSWVTGVAIVTSAHEGIIHGMTANSFNSIALDPPTVLVALQRHTRTQHLVKAGGVFAVTILDISQVKLAQRFAGQIETGRQRFEDVATFTMETGAPLIKGGVTYLDCEVFQQFDVGNTTVFIGRVVSAQTSSDQDQDPLLYFNQQWRKLDRL